MSRVLQGVFSGLLIIALSLALACSGGDDGDDNGGGSGGSGSGDSKALFDPKRADELAHKALLTRADLPGSGWDVTSTDEFDDEEDPELDELLRTEPACKDLRELDSLGIILGADSGSVGRAQIAIEKNAASPIAMPLSVDHQIDIEETTAKISDTWNDVKRLLESANSKNCMLAVFRKAFADQAAEEDEFEFKLTLDSMTPLASAPQNGTALAYRMKLEVPQLLSFDALMHLYLWPYSNAGVTVMFLGDPKDLTASFLQDTLKKIDEKVVNAAK